MQALEPRKTIKNPIVELENDKYNEKNNKNIASTQKTMAVIEISNKIHELESYQKAISNLLYFRC